VQRLPLLYAGFLFSVFLSLFFVERESSFGFGRMEKPNVLEHTWL